jgi:hypothetical protein
MAKPSASSKTEYVCNNVLIIIREGNEWIIDESVKDFIDKVSTNNAVNVYRTEKLIYKPKYQFPFRELSMSYNKLNGEIDYIISDDEVPIMILEQAQRHLMRIGFSKSILINSFSGKNLWSFFALK